MTTDNNDHDQDAPRPRRSRSLVVEPWTGRQLAIGAFVVALVVYLIWQGTPTFVYVVSRLGSVCATLILAGVLAYVVTPICNTMGRVTPLCATRAGRMVSTLTVFILLSAVLALMTVVIGEPLVSQVSGLNASVVEWLKEAPKNIEALMQSYAMAVPEEVAAVINERVTGIASSVLDTAGNIAVGAVWHVWSIVEAFLVPVLAFYFITDSERLRSGTLAILPRKHRERGSKLMDEMNLTLHSYIRGQIILCLLAAVITAFALWMLDVPVFLTLALIAGISRAIPVIGPIIGGAVIVAITWIQVDFRAAAIAAIIFSIMQFLESKIVMPKVLGHHADLHPVIIIVALLAGGEFFGILGMFVAVPIVAVLRIAYLHWRAAVEPPEADAA